jgi:aminomethyltransferase
VRERAGMFDVSHMGEVLVHGGGAAAFVQHLVTNDVARLDDNQAMYTVMCNEAGGIIDDLIVVRGDQTHFLIVVNASTREKDVAWMRRQLSADVELIDASDDIALIAVQGPRAVDILEPLVELDPAGSLRDLGAFRTSPARIRGIDGKHAQRIARTGYTGEDGFEIYIAAAAAGTLWDLLLEAGATHGLVPAGLGARDTLRLEAGLRLYGQDMDDDTDPYSCGLGWTVKLDKGDFVGAAALRGLRESPPRRFVGLKLGPRAIARHGHRVLQNGTDVGEVTSGTMGFSVGAPVATASVQPDFAAGEAVSVDIRGAAAAAEVVRLPFYKRPKGGG